MQTCDILPERCVASYYFTSDIIQFMMFVAIYWYLYFKNMSSYYPQIKAVWNLYFYGISYVLEWVMVICYLSKIGICLVAHNRRGRRWGWNWLAETGNWCLLHNWDIVYQVSANPDVHRICIRILILSKKRLMKGGLSHLNKWVVEGHNRHRPPSVDQALSLDAHLWTHLR